MNAGQRQVAWLTAAVAAVAAVYVWRDAKYRKMIGGAYKRHLMGSGVRGAALDNSLGQVTPDHLLFFGPTMRPPHWRPHRMSYPAAPGQELERLVYGAPGACSVAVPRELRGWLFAPPSEVDF